MQLIVEQKEVRDVRRMFWHGRKTWSMLLFAQILLLPIIFVDVIAIKLVTDYVIVGRRAELLFPIAGGILGVFIIATLLEAWLQYKAICLGQFWDGLVKGRLLRRVLGKPLLFYRQLASGEILYRVLNDSGALSAYMTQMRWSFITNTLMTIAGLVVVIYLNLSLALVFLAVIPFQILALRHLGQYCRACQEQLKQQDQTLLGNLDNVMVNVESVKAFSMEGRAWGDWFAEYRSRLLTERRLTLAQRVLAVGVLRLGTCGSMVAFMWGAYHVSTGAMTMGALMAFALVTGKMVGPVQFIAQYHLNVQEVIMCSRRVNATWMANETHLMPGARMLSRASIRRLHAITDIQQLELTNVWFGHGQTQFVLRNINWQLPLGQVVRLEGKNGSGKSTLLRVMANLLVPQSGKVEFNGISFERLGSRAIRRAVVYSSGESYWFRGTVAENLCYPATSGYVSTTKLQNLLELVGVEELMAQLPKGIDTMMSPGAENFSRGEQQRLALVRLLLAKPPFAFLDEAIASVHREDACLLLRRVVDYLRPTSTIVYVHHGQGDDGVSVQTVTLNDGMLSGA